MIRQSISALYLCLLAAPVFAQTGPAPASTDVATVEATATEAVPEKILVVGQRPGPGLWKVTHGDHVLWVFGTYRPLPQKMEWRSQQIDTILSQSQEYIGPPSVAMQVGLWGGLTMLPFLAGVKKNPDGAQLKDVLPAEVYARWLALKAKYIGADDGIERERPFFAAETLYDKGLAHAGLSNKQDVLAVIEQKAKQHKLKMTSTHVAVEMDAPAKTVRDFKKSPMDDAACFAITLDRLESDIDTMRMRANAWAIGDLEVIRKLDFADREAACKDALFSNTGIRQQAALKEAEAHQRTQWLAAADKALAANPSTFAVLSMKELLDPKGLLAELQAKGYTVQAPE
jgi:uncharacterized protein YbaP (TraB family)